MSQELAVFKFKELPVRVIVDENGEPWWVAKDVCTALGLKTVWMALKSLPDDEKGKRKVFTQGGYQEMLVISEPGRYRLTMRSNMKTAQPFQDLVVKVILPAIRKTGSYHVPTKEITTLDVIQQSLDVLKSHEQKLTEHDHLFVTLQADIQTIHQTQVKMLDEPVRQIELDAVLRAHMSQYGREQGFTKLPSRQCQEAFRAIWNELYREFFYRYGINLKIQKISGGYKSRLAAAKAIGCVDKLLALATKLYPIKKQKKFDI